MSRKCYHAGSKGSTIVFHTIACFLQYLHSSQSTQPLQQPSHYSWEANLGVREVDCTHVWKRYPAHHLVPRSTVSFSFRVFTRAKVVAGVVVFEIWQSATLLCLAYQLALANMKKWSDTVSRLQSSLSNLEHSLRSSNDFLIHPLWEKSPAKLMEIFPRCIRLDCLESEIWKLEQ